MTKIEDIEALAKRRGFFWPSAEIYGGISGFYDYGPLGTALKRKLENLWREYFLSLNKNFYEIETTNIMPEKVFIASGHVKNFVDPTVKCKKCGAVNRADHIIEEFLGRSFEGVTPKELTKIIKEHNIKCNNCGGELGDVEVLNMMFPVSIGAEGEAKGYLRAETAQGAYLSFLRAFNAMRENLPLGLAIIGRAYRNEISPRQLIIRGREFTQAELQIFFDPKNINEHKDWNNVKDYKLILLPVSEIEKGKVIKISCDEATGRFEIPKFYVYYMAKVQQFYLDKLKIPNERFRFRELSAEERAFYNKIHWDMELNLDIYGWKELGGVHYRTDHDLSGHKNLSKKDTSVFFDGRRFIPHVLELSFGIDRTILALLGLSLEKRDEKNILKLPPVVAPFIAGVYPLVNKDGIDDKAKCVYVLLCNEKLDVFYDGSGSIGRRYARADEIGVPFAITIDYQTLEDGTVTLRDRDTTKQTRVKSEEIGKTIKDIILKT